MNGERGETLAVIAALFPLVKEMEETDTERERERERERDECTRRLNCILSRRGDRVLKRVGMFCSPERTERTSV